MNTIVTIIFSCGLFFLCILLEQEIKTLKKKKKKKNTTNNMIPKYRILERTWADYKKDYVVQEYSKKWYSKKYKWRTMLTHYSSSYGGYRSAVFTSKEEAEKYIREYKYANCVINEQVVEEY